jgi:hypothetical protein
MNINTDEWLPLANIEQHSKTLRQRTAYRLAEELRLIHVFFGVKCIRKADVLTLESNRRPLGNRQWIESYEAAAAAAKAANASKSRRLKEAGPTKAEKKRNAGMRTLATKTRGQSS